jgi:hypothetical protein
MSSMSPPSATIMGLTRDRTASTHSLLTMAVASNSRLKGNSRASDGLSPDMPKMRRWWSGLPGRRDARRGKIRTAADLSPSA